MRQRSHERSHERREPLQRADVLQYPDEQHHRDDDDRELHNPHGRRLEGVGDDLPPPRRLRPLRRHEPVAGRRLPAVPQEVDGHGGGGGQGDAKKEDERHAHADAPADGGLDGEPVREAEHQGEDKDLFDGQLHREHRPDGGVEVQEVAQDERYRRVVREPEEAHQRGEPGE